MATLPRRIRAAAIRQRYRKANQLTRRVVTIKKVKANTAIVTESYGADENGNELQGADFEVNLGYSNYSPRAGFKVYIVPDALEQGAWVIDQPVRADMQAKGVSVASLNPNAPQRQFVTLQNSTTLLSRPVGTTNNGSTVVTVYPLIYDFDGLTKFDGTTTLASKVDLSSLIPATGYHRLVGVYLDGYRGTLHAAASTTVAISTALDFEDIIELDSKRPPDALPIAVYRLADNQTTITESSIYEDVRQFLNVPSAAGWSSNPSRSVRLRPTYVQQTKLRQTYDAVRVEVLGRLEAI